MELDELRRVGLALGLKGSAHGLAVGISCTRVLNKKKKKKKNSERMYLDSKGVTTRQQGEVGYRRCQT